MICDILIVNWCSLVLWSIHWAQLDLWNIVLQLLWNVKNEDMFEHILNHYGSLEMIYAFQQKLLQLQALFSDM